MLISYDWLKEFVDVDISAAECAKVLTSIGLENGPVEMVESIRGGLEGLVVGEVLTCIPHPNSDHLHLTTVTIGGPEVLQIVCGAPNVAAGQKVIVATVGTRLYMGDQELTIKRSKIRGVESYGMICAEDEIGIGDSHEGIIVLPADTPPGMPATKYYGLESRAVLEVDLTPNRADALSHYGVARDLAAWLKTQGKTVQLRRPSVEAFKVDNNNLNIEVEVLNTEACPRYCGLTMTGVRVAESPKWLQDRLRLIGQHPINNVVDITNYLLHESGQPLHAFDAAKIKGNKVVVRTLPEGTPFITLDGVERKLSAQDLMICNAEEGMCVAGVFGGKDSGVTEQTTELFLESAYFNPVWVRKTARRLGLNTDASYRFERGVDPANTLYVLKRAALMIKELAGGQISSEILDCYPHKIEDFVVDFTYDKCHKLIGEEIPATKIKEILAALEIKILEEDQDRLKLQVPAYRVDVQRDVDVIEDILRIYGYNSIQTGDGLRTSLSYTRHPDSNRLQQLISEQLTAAGFNEVLNNSLVSSAHYEGLETFPQSACVRLLNPLSKDLSVMRQSLLFGGLQNLAYNINRKNQDLRLYEFGNCYQYRAEKKTAENSLAAYDECMHLGLWLCGDRNPIHWMQPASALSFYDLKAYVHTVLLRLGLEPEKLEISEVSTGDIFAQALCYSSKSGQYLLTMGAVKPTILQAFDIDLEVFYADIHWDNLLKALKINKTSFKELPKFPEVRRDLALLLDQSVSFSMIEDIARTSGKQLLKSLRLFDVYEGKNLPAGKKSYAVTFVLRDENQTLTEERIDVCMQKIIKNLQSQLGASLR
ncbi:MAG: phenylalanine--tRNA ligase subunit beta [Bacteroidales bacterium]|nr:phenylalanine--tRNA ligase subunit beta [Bacteroidales bacterium]